MQVIVLDDTESVARLGADLVCELLGKKQNAVLGLATGNTPIALYRELVSAHQKGRVSFRDVTTFNLDEYLDIAANNPQSYRSYMQRELFDHIDIDRSKTHLPQCGDEYEKLIAEAGGIDLQILGIGRNGHIGFNEPTSSLSSRTRVKTLSESTVRDNSKLFEPGETQPHLAMTMGIATILESRQAALLATGKEKAEAVRDAIEGPLAAMCPASALQLHPKASFILDPAAAEKLKLLSYYRWAYKQNTDLLRTKP